MVNILNLFKCKSTSSNTKNITQKKNGTFAGYKMYNGCKGFSIYYKLPGDDDEDVRADNLLADCSLIRLPVYSLSDGDLFNLLGPEILVEWKLSDECYQCHYGGGQCQTDQTKRFHCTNQYNPHAQGTSKTGHRWRIWYILTTGAVLLTVALLVLLFFFGEKIVWYKYIRFWESNAEDHKNIEAFLKNYGSYTPKRYSYSEVKRITSGFKNKLGQGGFGSVYKGSMHNGSHMAVKVLNRLKGSGEEFINKVASISKTSHVNIVNLVGFCFECRKRVLIYEFMSNGSLEKFIYEERSDGVRQLGWPILYKIALGIA